MFFFLQGQLGDKLETFFKAIVLSHTEILQIFQICSILITSSSSLLKDSSGQSSYKKYSLQAGCAEYFQSCLSVYM